MGVDKLVMTEEEICRSFDEAKNKKEEITILSAVNLCKKKQIEEVLLKHGKIAKGTYNSYISSRARAEKPETNEKKTASENSDILDTVPETVKELINERIRILEGVIFNALKEKDELVTFLRKEKE